MLTRGVFETVGIQYYIHKKMVEYTEKSAPESLHKLFLSALFGRRDDVSWPETAIQVLTAIDHMGKEFKGLRGEYDHLCEYAHPNLKGGFGSYVRQEGEEAVNPQVKLIPGRLLNRGGRIPHIAVRAEEVGDVESIAHGDVLVL
jgi:hypothetical protein